jgi:hypothetical protein
LNNAAAQNATLDSQRQFEIDLVCHKRILFDFLVSAPLGLLHHLQSEGKFNQFVLAIERRLIYYF